MKNGASPVCSLSHFREQARLDEFCLHVVLFFQSLIWKMVERCTFNTQFGTEWGRLVMYWYSFYRALWFHCAFTVSERWDHVENMSISQKGSNPPFSGVKLLFSSQCICHNWHSQRNKAEYATNSVTEAALQIAVNFTYPKMNVKKIFLEWT